jgi:two-component system response regulator QseB
MDASEIDRVATAVGRPAVLVVEDDTEVRDMLIRILEDSGYTVDAVADGHSGLHHALTRAYDAMVIDRGLPAIDGLDLVGRLRRRGVATPMMLLTAYGSVADRVAGLDAGAEDYLVKPFEIDEFLARVRALLRRHRSSDLTEIGTATLDMTTRTVTLGDGNVVELSGREAVLLRALATRGGRTASRPELRTEVFEAAESATIVDTYVHYLRRKLGPGVVRTVRGHGYRIGRL